ncbi:MAG: ABC transporter ATP-binding protein [Candidatus Krumholzibacteria bacterium]|nr:ABC transporter ATP-binding protein [Candidatus Krumholzibacteria bacterium]
MKQLLRLVRFIGEYWRYFSLASAVSLVLILVQIPTPYFTRLLLDRVYPDGDIGLLGFIVVTQFALSLFGGLLGVARDYFQLNVGIKMGLEVGQRFLTHLESLPFSFYDERRTGEILTRFSDAHNAMNSTVGIVTGVFLNILQLLIFPVICFLISWKLTLLALITYPIDIWIYTLMNRSLYRRGKVLAQTRADLQASLYEGLSGIRTVQALGVEKHIEEGIYEQLRNVARKRLGVGRVSMGGGFSSGIVRGVGALILTWFGWRYVVSGDISLGAYFAFTMYLGYLNQPLRSLFGISRSIQRTLVHADRFFEIYDEVPEIRDRDGGGLPLPATIESITFENVSFGYEQDRPVITDVSLDIPIGKTTAIVGRSGVGKTTLVNLLPRFYDPQLGHVALNGVGLRDYGVKDLRRGIGYAMQRTSFFGGTIREELTLGDPSVTDDRLRAAAKEAYILDFIESLPEGFETPLKEFAVNMSEGQRQRLALARVFALDRPILILDEPTSSLDTASEAYVQRSLARLRISRTVIIIAHRLSTIETADKVVVMHKGTIVQEGTFETLVNTEGELRTLYRGLARI